MDVILTDKIWENDMCSSLDLEISTDTDVDAINYTLLNIENQSLANDMLQWRDACLEQFGDLMQTPQLEDDSHFLIY